MVTNEQIMDEIKSLKSEILGNEKTGRLSVFHRITKLEEHNAKENLSKAKKTGFFIGLSAVGGGFGAWLKSLIGL